MKTTHNVKTVGFDFSSMTVCRCYPSIKTCFLGMLVIILNRDAALE